MSVVLVLALALQPVPTPAPEVERDIVVIGEKLKNWRARVRQRDGAMRCQTKSSSGDKDIDAIGCSAMAGCLTDLRPRLMASIDKTLDAAQRKALDAAVQRDMGTCVMSRRDAMIADLAERRFEARQGNSNAAN